MLFQLAVGIYGGYFGAGIGILMLAALSILGLNDIHEMNSLKVVFGGSINGIAAAYFIWARHGVLAVRADHGGGGDCGRLRRRGHGAQTGAHGGAADRDRDRFRDGDLTVREKIGHVWPVAAYIYLYESTPLRRAQPAQGADAQPGGDSLGCSGNRRQYRNFFTDAPDPAEFPAGGTSPKNW